MQVRSLRSLNPAISLHHTNHARRHAGDPKKRVCFTALCHGCPWRYERDVASLDAKYEIVLHGLCPNFYRVGAHEFKFSESHPKPESLT